MDLNYRYLQSSPILDVLDFSKSGVKNAKSVEKICNQISQVLVIPKKNVELFALGEHVDGFRFDAYSSTGNKVLLAQFYYIPDKKIFDIYDTSNDGYPLIGWRGKVLKIKNYSGLLDKLHLEKLFASILSLT